MCQGALDVTIPWKDHAMLAATGAFTNIRLDIWMFEHAQDRFFRKKMQMILAVCNHVAATANVLCHSFLNEYPPVIRRGNGQSPIDSN